jgi:hypothetical protein
MHLTPIPCTDPAAEKLMKDCRKNYSDDSAPFYMSQLLLFDLKTPSPITQQTALGAAEIFLKDIPHPDFKKHIDSYYLEGDNLVNVCISEFKKTDFENNLEGWLTAYKGQVRSPIRKEDYANFKKELYDYLGKPKFFFTANRLFVSPNYYCDNINALILTQNHGKFPMDKLAMFSFFSPD